MSKEKKTVEPKQELKDRIRHLRQAARCSCDSYIGRQTRQLLNRQADEMERLSKEEIRDKMSDDENYQIGDG